MRLPARLSMPFSIRPFRRFPVCCPVTYHAGLHEGQGTIWNVSLNGWRLSGDLPLRIGQSFPMTVTLSNQESVFVAAGIVRWVRGEEYGVETLVADDSALDQVKDYIKQQFFRQQAAQPVLASDSGE
jgi:PilZ domain